MKLVKLLAVAALLGAVSHSASAQLVTRTQTLDITVTAVDSFTISNAAITATVTVGAGSFSGGTYSVVTNSGTARVIKGQIDSNFPTSLGLTVTFAGGTGAQSLISASATNLVTGLSNTSVTNAAITFNTAVTTALAAGALAQRTVTYTFQ